jgi:hypothetical protein
MTSGLAIDWRPDDGDKRTDRYEIAAAREEVEALAEEINAMDRDDVAAHTFDWQPVSIAGFRVINEWIWEPREKLAPWTIEELEAFGNSMAAL